MNPNSARSLVLVSYVVSGGVIVYDIVKHGEGLGPGEDFRVVWAISLLFLLLAIMADVVPELAGPFAALVLLAILLGRGAVVKQIVNLGTKTKEAPGP